MQRQASRPDGNAGATTGATARPPAQSVVEPLHPTPIRKTRDCSLNPDDAAEQKWTANIRYPRKIPPLQHHDDPGCCPCAEGGAGARQKNAPAPRLMPLGMAPCSCAKYDLAGHTDGTPATPISSERESRLISCRSPSQQSAIREQPSFHKLHTTHLPSSPHTVVQQSAISDQPAFRKLYTTHLPSSSHTVVDVSLFPPYAAPASLRSGSHTGQPPFSAATA